MKINGKDQKKKAPGRGIAPLLAFALTVLAVLAAPALNGEAKAVDFNKDCSLKVNPGSPDLAEDLAKAGIMIDLYKVADAAPVAGYDTYTYQMTDAYKGIEIPEYPGNDDWKALSQKAAAIALNGKPDIEGVPVDQPQTGLKSGLYLVIARGSDVPEEGYVVRTKGEDGSETVTTLARTNEYVYSFLPELVSLPGKEAVDGNVATSNPGDWIYDMEITLKPEQALRYGSLEIVKQLDTYETKDPATFVFQVEAVLGGQTVYSDVVSLTFTEPGQKSVLLDRIPVSAQVKVTEVYSGAVYTPTTAAEQNTVIEANRTVQTAFTNDYDDTHKGGGSVTNRFTYAADQWGWTQVGDEE